MTVYRYQSGSLLDSVQVLTNEAGGMRAYLFAAGDAPSNELRAKKQAIRDLGWKCVPIVHDGKPALEVRGFKDADELTVELHRLGITGAVTSITADEGDKRSRKDKLSNATLKLAGLSYNIGDAAYLTYAYRQYKDELVPVAETLKGNHTNFFNKVNIFAGLGYGLGSLALTFYGSRDQSLNTINSANRKIYAHLRNQGIEVPEGSTLKSSMEEKDRGFWGNINHTLAKYPSETLNSVYVGVGLALMAAAGYRATRSVKGLEGEVLAKALKERKDEWWDVGLGSVTAASAIAGLTIKEKKPMEGDEKRKGLGRILDWIQEKPLRATGYGYMAATLLHAKGTYNKYYGVGGESVNQSVRKTVLFRGVFVVANLFSELMLALSSKGHGAGVKPDDSVDKSVIGATAELILRQPPEKREALIENMAGYMASREVLGVKAETIAAELRTHINLLDNNPWTKHYVPNQKGEMQEVEVNATAKQIAQEHAAHSDKPSHTIHQAEYVAKHQPALAQGVSA